VKLKLKKKVKKTIGKIKPLSVEIVSVDSVKPWKDNPRINEQAAKKLAPILKCHGQVTPIVVWEKNKVIYKGNTTHKALKMNGEKTVKVLFVDFPSESSAVAYGIADNRSSEFSYWDDELLEKMMETGQLDYEEMGFTKREFRAITLLPDVDIVNRKAEHKALAPLNSIVVKCETDILDDLRKDISEIVAQYHGKAVMA